MAYVWYGTAIAIVCGLSVALTTGVKPWPERLKTRSVAELVAAEATPTQNADLEAYQAAAELAKQAVVSSEKAITATDSIERSHFIQQERSRWQSALQKLDTIPPDSALFERATSKQRTYQQSLADAIDKTNALQKTFLDDTLKEVPVDPGQVHITLCQLSDKIRPTTADEHLCRQHQGDQPLASAASLIKVPIAIALIQKANADNLPLTTKVFTDPNNYTENAAGLSLEVGKQYSLQEIMSQMIQSSDNIATNQLIDYLGYEAINQALSDYPQTTVGHKLMGSEIMPADFGQGTNQVTTDDITAMMAYIYSPNGSQAIRTALTRQQDREFGHAALTGVGAPVQWIGEKTGQNNLLIGTTLAMTIREQSYVLTVAIDNSSDTLAIQQIISRIATHLMQNGSFATGLK